VLSGRDRAAVVCERRALCRQARLEGVEALQAQRAALDCLLGADDRKAHRSWVPPARSSSSVLAGIPCLQGC
jgi:hypothetical protein